MAFQHLKGDYKDDGERLFARTYSDRTEDNSFKLKESTYKLDVRKKYLYCGDSEALEQIAHRSCGFSIPGSVQCQGGWGFVKLSPSERCS